MELIPVTATAPGAVGAPWVADRDTLIDPTVVAAALARGLDAAQTAVGSALARLRAEFAGAPELVVGWQSCLLPPPPDQVP